MGNVAACASKNPKWCSPSEIEAEISEGNVNLRTAEGRTPLMTAAYYGRKDVLELLIKHGAVVNAIDEQTGDTAAHYVTLSLCGSIRQCACVMVLVENGANIDIRNNDGYTVYDLARKNGNNDIGNTGDALMSSPA